MSRSIANRGLAKLLASRRIQIGGLACALKVHRASIFLYSSAVRPSPLLEKRMADFFDMAVPELRHALGLPTQPVKRSPR